MRFLVDTCVVSDARRPARYPELARWLDAQDPDLMAVSVLTLGELRYGVAKLPAGRKRAELLTWVDAELRAYWAGRILPIDARVAEVWGTLRAAADTQGRSLPVTDGLILATAQVHSLTVVTRNEPDFADLGTPVICPY